MDRIHPLWSATYTTTGSLRRDMSSRPVNRYYVGFVHNDGARECRPCVHGYRTDTLRRERARKFPEG